MPKVTFIQPAGSAETVDVRPGATVMEAAVDNDIEGIVAECGGACSCATCHVYVEPEWLELLPPPDGLEDGMLDCVVDRQANSRLSCQIGVDESLDGITVRIPEAQV